MIHLNPKASEAAAALEGDGRRTPDVTRGHICAFPGEPRYLATLAWAFFHGEVFSPLEMEQREPEMGKPGRGTVQQMGSSEADGLPPSAMLLGQLMQLCTCPLQMFSSRLSVSAFAARRRLADYILARTWQVCLPGRISSSDIFSPSQHGCRI